MPGRLITVHEEVAELVIQIQNRLSAEGIEGPDSLRDAVIEKLESRLGVSKSEIRNPDQRVIAVIGLYLRSIRAACSRYE